MTWLGMKKKLEVLNSDTPTFPKKLHIKYNTKYLKLGWICEIHVFLKLFPHILMKLLST